MKAMGRGDGEVGEQPEPLGLLQYRADLKAIGPAQIQHAEGVEPDHEFRGEKTTRGAEVTQRQRQGNARAAVCPT